MSKQVAIHAVVRLPNWQMVSSYNSQPAWWWEGGIAPAKLHVFTVAPGQPPILLTTFELAQLDFGDGEVYSCPSGAAYRVQSALRADNGVTDPYPVEVVPSITTLSLEEPRCLVDAAGARYLQLTAVNRIIRENSDTSSGYMLEWVFDKFLGMALFDLDDLVAESPQINIIHTIRKDSLNPVFFSPDMLACVSYIAGLNTSPLDLASYSAGGGV